MTNDELREALEILKDYWGRNPKPEDVHMIARLWTVCEGVLRLPEEKEYIPSQSMNTSIYNDGWNAYHEEVRRIVGLTD